MIKTTIQKVIFEKDEYRFETREDRGYDDTVSDHIVMWEMFVENVYQLKHDHFNDTKTAIDIGANIGAFSIFAVAMGAERVIAYEPDSENYPQLQKNLDLNNMLDKVETHQLGVLDKGGHHKLFHGQGASFVNGIKNLTARAQANLDSGKITDETIEVISLASVFADNKIANVDVMKIDVEGSEYKIIEGTTPEILAKAKFITIEFHSTEASTFGAMIAKLSLTHNLHIIGHYDIGGNIYGDRY